MFSRKKSNLFADFSIYLSNHSSEVAITLTSLTEEKLSIVFIIFGLKSSHVFLSSSKASHVGHFFR